MSHQVEAVEVIPLHVPLKRPFQIASTRLEEVQNIAIAIGLDSGAMGLGEIATLFPVTADRFESAFAAATSLASWLEDQVFEDESALIWALRNQESSRPAIAAGFEMAILDAVSTERELPLHAFFGAAKSPILTNMTIPICEPELCFELANDYRQQGFRTLKLKVGISLEQDLACVRAIKNAHPDCRIIADANAGFSISEAHEFLDALGKEGILVDLFEQPVARDALPELFELSQRGDTLIAADESCRSVEDAKRLADSQSAHVLNIKLAKSGVIGGQAIHKIAQDAGLGLMIGGMIESRIAMGFAAHFASGLGGFDWVDLDTPQLLSEDPIQNGTTFDGPRWDIKDTPHGHGASLAGIDLF
jgi:L-alanine-DL-glutamate epimerase-like enolase superfamily enzyme